MRTIGLGISDTHAGFKFGLLNPDVTLLDSDMKPYTPGLTAIQEHFWKLFLQGCEAVKLWANGDPIVAIHFGDITHGNQYPTNMVSTEMADQPVIAVANMRPILELPNLRSFTLATGTGAHNFREGSAERLTMDFVRVRYPKINFNLVPLGLGDVDGMQIEFAHQGAYPGSKLHLKGNVAHHFLRDRMTEDLLHGKTPPRLYGYGHWHEWVFVTETVSVGDKDYTSSLFVMPSFNFPNLWATAATRSKSRFTHGIVAFEVIDGKLIDVKRFTKTIDRRVKVVL